MNKKVVACILLFALLNATCNKGTNNAIDVSSITETDALGNSLGHTDNTDWTKDNNRSSTESNLFESPTPVQLANTETASLTMGAFPNPAGAAFMFYFNATAAALAQIVITDKSLKIKEQHYYKGKAGTNLLQISLDPAKYANNTNYRVYYSFYSLADGQYYKGHGDIKISR